MNNDAYLNLLSSGGYNSYQTSPSSGISPSLEGSELSGVQGLSSSSTPFLGNDLMSDSGLFNGGSGGLMGLGLSSGSLQQAGLGNPSDMVQLNNMLSDYSNALNSYADADDADDADDDDDDDGSGGINVV